MACALWILGFELAPGVHLAVHAELAAHSHGHARPGASHGQTRIFVHTDAHAHDGIIHAHPGSGHDHANAARDLAQTGQAAAATLPLVRQGRVSVVPSLVPFEPGLLAHGEHSLAHRDLAVVEPPPVLPVIPPVALRPVPHDEHADDAPHSQRRRAQPARGPPAR